jgi:hypothetical protein
MSSEVKSAESVVAPMKSTLMRLLCFPKEQASRRLREQGQESDSS